jgi:hypothetical protein
MTLHFTINNIGKSSKKIDFDYKHYEGRYKLLNPHEIIEPMFFKYALNPYLKFKYYLN